MENPEKELYISRCSIAVILRFVDILGESEGRRLMICEMGLRAIMIGATTPLMQLNMAASAQPHDNTQHFRLYSHHLI